MKLHPKALIKKYREELEATDGLTEAARWESQYDDYSAAINYCVVREHKPRVVVEFGARTGKCTYDILRALIKNKGRFKFKSYELDPNLAKIAMQNIFDKLGRKFKIGGDILKAKDIPDKIEYLFVDNSHDGPTTDWVFSYLLPRCVPGAIIQIHDIPLNKDFSLKKDSGVFKETSQIIQMHKNHTLPLKKLYLASVDTEWESSWWEYRP